MRRRRHSHRRRNHTVRNIIIGCFVITLFLATGYSAFQTAISINVKGNIKKYKVNFDPNGGYIDISSKYVGTKYGDLPTPTREGYTFKGWNGKNKFDISSATTNGYAKIENDTVFFDASSVSGNTASYYALQKWNSGTYVGLLNSTYNAEYVVYIGRIDFPFKIEDYNFGRFHFILNTSSQDARIYFYNVIPLNTMYTFSFNVLYSDLPNAKATVNEIQLEEGTKSTDYEPYFITSETKVVQKYDHTLTAIWEENS